MKSAHLTIVVSNGTSAKSNLIVAHVEGTTRTQVLAGNQTQQVVCTNTLKGDHIRFVGVTTESPSINVAASYADNEVDRVLTAFDAEGNQVGSPQTIPANGGSVSFSDLPAESYLVIG
jgi:hypothetical protein